MLFVIYLILLEKFSSYKIAIKILRNFRFNIFRTNDLQMIYLYYPQPILKSIERNIPRIPELQKKIETAEKIIENFCVDIDDKWYRDFLEAIAKKIGWEQLLSSSVKVGKKEAIKFCLSKHPANGPRIFANLIAFGADNEIMDLFAANVVANRLVISAAILYGEFSLIEKLVTKENANDGLYYAAKYGDQKTVFLFLNKGATNYNDILHILKKREDFEFY